MPFRFPFSIHPDRTKTLTALPASLHSLSRPLRFIADTLPGQTGHRSISKRTPFRWCLKTVRSQPGTLSDINRNGVRFQSEHCPNRIGITVRIAPEYACGSRFITETASSTGYTYTCTALSGGFKPDWIIAAAGTTGQGSLVGAETLCSWSCLGKTANGLFTRTITDETTVYSSTAGGAFCSGVGGGTGGSN